MFDVAPTELLLVAIVALVVIGPKDLPKAMRFVGYWVGRARGVMRQFRSGFDSMVREAELEEMEKKWAAENARIMSEHPAPKQLSSGEAPATVIEHDGVAQDGVAPHGAAHGELYDSDAPPVMVEQPGFAPDPPRPLPVPAAPTLGTIEQSAPQLAFDEPVAEASITESGEGAPPPVKKPRKRKAAS